MRTERQTDIQTDIQTRWSQYFRHLPGKRRSNECSRF